MRGLCVLCFVISHVQSCVSSVAVAGRLQEWSTCVTFDPSEATVGPPYTLSLANPRLLNPAKQGSFAQHTLQKRLPATVDRLIGDKVVSEESAKRLRKLADEIPDQVPLQVGWSVRACVRRRVGCFVSFSLPYAFSHKLCVRARISVRACSTVFQAPVEVGKSSGLDMGEEFCARVNGEWRKWTQDRVEVKEWASAMPLICTEMYFHRRLLDCCGYFGEGESDRVLLDPFDALKSEALQAALASTFFRTSLERHLSQMQELQPDASLRALWSADNAVREHRFKVISKVSWISFTGSLKAGFVTETSGAGYCRAFRYISFIGSLKAGFVTETSGAGSRDDELLLFWLDTVYVYMYIVY